MEQIFGIHYNEDNLLLDDNLRGVVKPIDHYLRDWMHTLMGHGVAGTQMPTFHSPQASGALFVAIE